MCRVWRSRSSSWRCCAGWTSRWPRQHFALLGANGAGKTTVVKILSTLLKADTGTVGVNGLDVATQAGEVRASISLTGQFAAVDEILSGRENLVLVAGAAAPQGPGRDRR